MALAALASVADLEARGVTVDPSEETAVGVFLNIASALIRDAADSPVSQVTGTVSVEGGSDQWLRLPGQPVSAVSAVEIDGGQVADWRLVSGALWRACGWRSSDGPSEVAVTYTHGLPSVPEDIVDLACRLAAKALVSLRNDDDAGGMADRVTVSERLGDWIASYAYGDHFSEVEIPEYLRARLAARFGSGVASLRSR